MKKKPVNEGHDHAAAEPATTVRLHAAEVIDAQRTALQEHLGAAVKGDDPEGVHDMRVASRRLRAALEFFSPWLEDGEGDRLERDLRALTRALGKTRELDVLRLKLSELTPRTTPAGALALEHLDVRLARKRRKARSQMLRHFAKVDLDRVDLRLRRVAATLTRPARVEVRSTRTGRDPWPHGDASRVSVMPPPEANGALGSHVAAEGDQRASSAADERALLQPLGEVSVTEVVRVVAPRLVESVRDAVRVDLDEGKDGIAPAAAIHAARIAAKKLRYSLEIVAPYLVGSGQDVLRTLKKLQDGLGRFHDDAVLDDTLRAAAEHAESRERKLLATEFWRIRSVRRRVLLREERRVLDRLRTLDGEDFAGEVSRALAATVEPRQPVEATISP